ncbi:hypothetical protein ACFL6S_02265, partial [Candidatus Poribacteria bacterium]
LAPGGNPGPPDKGDGGTVLATFEVTIVGDVFGGPTLTTHEIKEGTKAINVPGYYGGEKMLLDLTFFHDGGGGHLNLDDAALCFLEGPVEGLLQVTKRDGNSHPSGVWFWFDGTGTDGEPVTYMLLMSGTFPDEPWPPTLESGSITIPLDGSWEMTTEGKKNKTACTGEGVFPNDTTVTVTRIE